MGCDIHVHTEIKVHGRWEHYSAPDIPRDYDLFTLMAGVRDTGAVRPIDDPRGLPVDISAVTKLDLVMWGPEAHSMSWLDADEVSRVEEWINPHGASTFTINREYFGDLFGNSWGRWSKRPEFFPAVIEDVRWVFWFDN